MAVLPAPALQLEEGEREITIFWLSTALHWIGLAGLRNAENEKVSILCDVIVSKNYQPARTARPSRPPKKKLQKIGLHSIFKLKIKARKNNHPAFNHFQLMSCTLHEFTVK